MLSLVVARIAWVLSWCADSTNNAVANVRQGGNMKTCSKPGCERKHSAKGLCKTHYTMRRKKLITKQCSIDGCDRVVWGRGWCSAHYEQFRRGLTPGERSLQKERVSVEPYLERINWLCEQNTIKHASELTGINQGIFYRWRVGKLLTISPEQIDRLEMVTWYDREDTSTVTEFAMSAEGMALINEMRGAA